MHDLFSEYESNVRSYCRSFPVVFKSAKMSKICSDDGKEYIDFFCGAGALNYGHNNDYIISRLIDYLKSDGIIHALDMYTVAKENFISTFVDVILKPRNLDYKLMFCGPTGTNANEAALKLARKVTGRQNIFSFIGAFHGMTLGSLSLSSDRESRKVAGVSLNNVTFMPFPYGFNNSFDTIAYMENVLTDDHSGIDKPAAVFLETVQAEGGVIVAEPEWIRRLAVLCKKYDILLICDDIQVGCGRTGTFFSFDRAGIQPDMVTLSKSISGCGLPMSLLLMRRELDVFSPGEHNGTFRGNQLAFVAATAAIEYAVENRVYDDVARKGNIISKYLDENLPMVDGKLSYRGIGVIYGIDFSRLAGDNSVIDVEKIGKLIQEECFNNGLIIERAGRHNSVMKIMPALTISDDELLCGLEILVNALKNVTKRIYDHDIGKE